MRVMSDACASEFIAVLPPQAQTGRIHLRLFAAKVLALVVVAGALVSNHVYAAEGFADFLIESVGLMLLVVGALGRVWSAAFISGKKSKVLVCVGPYSMTRNPLYFFSFLSWVGAGLSFGALTLAAAFAAVFLLTHLHTITQEEQFLQKKFGAAWDDYVQTVPRFFPRIHSVRGTPNATFEALPFTRVIGESALIMLVFVGTQLVEYLHAQEIIPVFVSLP